MTDSNQGVYHKSVLVNEVLHYLQPSPGKLYVDATFGGGGHSRAILQKDPTCRVIAFDWDQFAIERNAPVLQEEFGDRINIVFGNFILIERLLAKAGISKIDGVLADFGTSQFQISQKPGFSFQLDTPLDMRMSPAHQKNTAAHILNVASEFELAKIFFDYGEERYSRRIAREIVEARKQHRFHTTGQLVALIEKLSPFRHGPIHPATRVFQALRIAVNNELENIEAFLKSALKVLAPQGRLVCISFHSLEDRIVKNFFREQKGVLQILTPKPVQATEDELDVNPSARSAKLRAACRL
jgi:16S rRNA (cytosine1402-N4)-methyltransferase